MSGHEVSIFEPYRFVLGEKITIIGGPRRGDWEVTGFNEKKVQLRCPVTQKVVEWDRFCFFVKKLTEVPWPGHHSE